jgi:hypothetical protein
MRSAEKMHRILLLNFTDADAEVLRKAKFNVELGYLGAVHHLERQGMPGVSYRFPRPLYEYDISIYNSSYRPAEMEKLFPDARNGPLGDPMLEAFLEWRTRPNLRIAFTGVDQGVKTLVLAGLPFLKLSGAHEGVSMLEEFLAPGYAFAISELAKLISSFRKDVKHPVGQYFEIAKTQSFTDNHYPVILNRNGDQIAAYCTVYEKTTRPVYVVLPQLKNNAACLLKLLEVVAKVCPDLFPDREIRDWYNSEEFAFREEKEIDRQMEARVQETMRFIETKRAEREDVAKRFAFIKEILIAREDVSIEPDHRLSVNVRKVLEFLGFTVEDIDAQIKGAIRKEDFWVKDGDDFLAITEVTGTNAKNPKTKEFNDLYTRMATIFKRRELVPDVSRITGLLVVSYDIDTHPAKRPRLYGGDGEEIVQTAQERDIGLLSTQELYNIAIAAKDGVITKENARNLIKSSGRIEFKAEPPAKLPETAQD